MLTLEPHPARVKSAISGELVPIILDQKQIMLDGRRIGYCGVRPPVMVQFIRQMTDFEKQEVRQFVESELGAISSMSAPPIVPDELLRDDDEELDEEPEDEDEDE